MLPLRAVVALGLALVACLSLTAFASAATPSQVSFDGDSGSVTLSRPGGHTLLNVPGDASGDVVVRFRVRSDALPIGPGQVVAVLVRRSAGAEYRARLQFDADGSVTATVFRYDNRGAAVISGARRVPGVAWQPGRDLAISLAVRGTHATRLALKVWAAEASEPAGAQVVAYDKAGSGAGTGSARLRFAVPRNAGRTPVRFDFADLALTATGSTATPTTPTPAPTAATSTPTPASTATTTPTPASTAAATQSPTSTATPTPRQTPTTTPTPTPLPTPSPTATPGTLASPAAFVAPNGSDSADGSLANPWRTVQRAADTVLPGTTVYLRGGSYSPFTMRRSGTAGAPITFSSYPTEMAIIDGAGAVAYTIRLTGVRFVNLTHLVVQGGYADAHEGGGVLVEDSSQVEVADSLLRDNKAFGVRSQRSTYVSIHDNEVTHNAVGVHVGESGEGTVVADNRIHDNDKMMVNTPDIGGDDVGAGGVAVVKTTGHVLVRDNLVWGNRAFSYDYGYDGSAFEIYAAQNWEFTGNTAWDNRVAFETGTDANRTPCSNGLFTRNVIYGPASFDVARGVVLRCAENALVANNTFFGLQDFVFTLQHMVGTYGGSIEGLRIVNNVLYLSDAKAYSVDSAIPSSVVFDANLIYRADGGYVATMNGRGATASLATFRQWTGQEQHGVQADPDFINANALDFHLQPDSLAIDSGLVIPGLTDGYAGDAPDRGAFELIP